LTVAPGLVATPMMLTLPADLQKSLIEAIPFPNRLVSQDEMSRLVQHIIENVALNGEVIRLDGALRLAAK
jgi:NAD(P)-dependent dehydrogenase (short-subunit alcohol dehydrogenase family)